MGWKGSPKQKRDPKQGKRGSAKGRQKGSEKGLMRGLQVPRDCRKCDGEGTIVDRWKDSNGKWQKGEITCPDCDGTGEV